MKRTILREERTRKNLTMKQVSEAVGIDMTHYAKIEHGTSNPSWDVGCKLGKFFDIEACKLLRRDGDEEV